MRAPDAQAFGFSDLLPRFNIIFTINSYNHRAIYDIIVILKRSMLTGALQPTEVDI